MQHANGISKWDALREVTYIDSHAILWIDVGETH